jgi:hypothetical protein
MPKPVKIDNGPVLIPVHDSAADVAMSGKTRLSLASFDHRLPDGDRINIVVEAHDLPADRVAFKLRTQGGMWFKGIEIHSVGGVVRLEAENGSVTGAHTLLRTALPGAGLVLVKAKFGGVHTGMYALPATALTPLLGKRIIFDWMSD